MPGTSETDTIQGAGHRGLVACICAALTLAVVWSSTPVVLGDDADIGTGEDGWYEGTYVWTDQKGPKSKGADPSGSRKTYGSFTEEPI